MLIPLKQWFCDVCDGVIESPEQGRIERIRDKDNLQYEFKITHHAPECSFHGDTLGLKDMNLTDALGHEGIAFLLFLLDPNLIADPVGKGSQVKDLREYVELFRRLHIPYYEEARHYMARAKREGLIESLSGLEVRSIRLLQEIIKCCSEEDS